jgi:hypothetical protein
MRLKTRALIALIVLSIVHAVIPIPIVGIILIFVFFQSLTVTVSVTIACHKKNDLGAYAGLELYFGSLS